MQLPSIISTLLLLPFLLQFCECDVRISMPQWLVFNDQALSQSYQKSVDVAANNATVFFRSDSFDKISFQGRTFTQLLGVEHSGQAKWNRSFELQVESFMERTSGLDALSSVVIIGSRCSSTVVSPCVLGLDASSGLTLWQVDAIATTSPYFQCPVQHIAVDAGRNAIYAFGVCSTTNSSAAGNGMHSSFVWKLDVSNPVATTAPNPVWFSPLGDTNFTSQSFHQALSANIDDMTGDLFLTGSSSFPFDAKGTVQSPLSPPSQPFYFVARINGTDGSLLWVQGVNAMFNQQILDLSLVNSPRSGRFSSYLNGTRLLLHGYFIDSESFILTIDAITGQYVQHVIVGTNENTASAIALSPSNFILLSLQFSESHGVYPTGVMPNFRIFDLNTNTSILHWGFNLDVPDYFPTTIDKLYVTSEGSLVGAGLALSNNQGFVTMLIDDVAMKQGGYSPCPPGSAGPADVHKLPLTLLPECSRCTTGFFSNVMGLTTCDGCAPGYRLSENAKKGSHQDWCGSCQSLPSVGATSCIPCGQSQVNTTMCVICDIGTFSDSVGSIECQECGIAGEPGYSQCDSAPLIKVFIIVASVVGGVVLLSLLGYQVYQKFGKSRQSAQPDSINYSEM